MFIVPRLRPHDPEVQNCKNVGWAAAELLSLRHLRVLSAVAAPAAEGCFLVMQTQEAALAAPGARFLAPAVGPGTAPAVPST